MKINRRRPIRAAGFLAALAISAASLLCGLPAQAATPSAAATPPSAASPSTPSTPASPSTASTPAAPNGDGTANSDGGATTEAPKVDLVLDVSGSMSTADIQGRSRISVAQQSIDEVIDALPPEAEFGIRTLGATYPVSDKTDGCKDTQVLFPVGNTNKVEAKTAVATLRPTGWTPIGLALRGAAQDLGTGQATRRIVLITDGEDDCAPPDPCDVARELAAQGLHLVVDTLGLAHDDQVRQQLLCIANATGGTYTDVRTQQQLTDRVKQLVTRSDQTYRQTPAQVAGTDSCANAPELTPGVYADREKFSEHRVYRVAVKSGQELRAAVSVTPDRAVAPDYGVLLQATDGTGQELVRGTDAGSGRTDVASTGLRWSATGSATATASTSASPDSGSGSGTGSGTGTGTGTGTDGVQQVCLIVSNSFAPQPGVQTDPGLPVELTVDVVAASPAPAGPALGLGRGWILLLVLTGAGLLTGLVSGWVARWRIAVWQEN
ncbi:VWA domain-containing protein [Kitasatospora sp. NBC_01287]|uniref:VWA domain-containing protein n=1 Tax=Kitasatospora sp. NBC_01287 TaxID=2903573 RepID=UPI0022522C02|nr:VWA domain-containing protein [Kitasatospora sp. NBC_01287]MCX4751567.1 VWA domain-containing protein [Kitasatospora sp. NBC_01287]